MAENETIYPKLAAFMQEQYLKYLYEHGYSASQTDFGAWMGISSANISRYVTGKQIPGNENLKKMAAKLGVGLYEACDLEPRVPADPVIMDILHDFPDLTPDERRMARDDVHQIAERRRKVRKDKTKGKDIETIAANTATSPGQA